MRKSAFETKELNLAPSETGAELGCLAVDGSRRRDEVVNDGKCLQRCNNQLNIGMDMVNVRLLRLLHTFSTSNLQAHMAFGSIDVPSVVEKRDLELFCMLDYQHSQCIDECGYSVQFNLREYVCRNRFTEVCPSGQCLHEAMTRLLLQLFMSPPDVATSSMLRQVGSRPHSSLPTTVRWL